MRVEVTARHIKAGQRRNPGGCPVAIAVREALGPSSCVSVGSQIAVCSADVWRTWRAPKEVVDFERAFDDGYDVEPFSFDLPEQPS